LATHPISQNATIRRAKQSASTSTCNTTNDLGGPEGGRQAHADAALTPYRYMLGALELPGLIAGANEDLVDCHPAVTGDDVRHCIGDVVRTQGLDPGGLSLCGLPDVVTNVGDASENAATPNFVRLYTLPLGGPPVPR
ncbi:MAG: hypothetical protein QOF40_810, partial [Actinomycetota bacterium]|nr:hypothetical protein [Actinomycetota bacterium]